MRRLPAFGFNPQRTKNTRLWLQRLDCISPVERGASTTSSTKQARASGRVIPLNKEQVLWLVSSALFSWYIANFGAYDATYGSLGAAIGMMMWMWISMIVILLGAQLNAEIEHQTSQDSTVGPDKPLGRRGAVKANTIGAVQN
jgi:Virulence factor BrkB